MPPLLVPTLFDLLRLGSYTWGHERNQQLMATFQFGDRVRVKPHDGAETGVVGRVGCILGSSPAWPGKYIVSLDVIEGDTTTKPRVLLEAQKLEAIDDVEWETPT